MLTPWLWLAPLLVAGAAESGASLRGAVEALQRRQRGHRIPYAPPSDYDSLYEFIPPPGYPEPDYAVDVEDLEEQPPPKYIVKFLEENDRAPETYEYKIIKKNSRSEGIPRKESPFRERTHHSDNDKLRDLFADRGESEDDRNNEIMQDRAENDAEYALLLGQLWSKYKNNKIHGNPETAPQGVVKLYKDKIIKKRYSDNWGPIAFKKKRSSGSDIGPVSQDFHEEEKIPATSDPTYNSYDVSDDDKDDWREEYAIAFQPLDDDSLTDLNDDDQYSYEVEKRFPVAKRSSGPYNFNNQKKRFAPSQKQMTRTFRSSSGTDPRIIKDLSKIFGDMEIKNPVKRNADETEQKHEAKPPTVIISNNKTLDQNDTMKHDEDSHELSGHGLHHPGISAKEAGHDYEHSSHDHDHEHAHVHSQKHDHAHHEKPKIIRKKSIDWSDYFGIDKRGKKFLNNANQDRLRKQYFDTFNKEVVYPVNSFRKHRFTKRNYVETRPNEENDIEKAPLETNHNDDKRDTAKENDSKLDSIDKNLKNMEGMLVDDALRYSEVEEEMDTKEEQEMKEKLLSRLAAAYSLEKMRKALREFKQSLVTQRTAQPNSESSDTDGDTNKAKRVAVKKEKVDISNNEIPSYREEDKNEDFEEEQGAGHYLNGKTEQQFSEGYMGGSGRHRIPVVSTGGAAGACPVLAKIVQRCRGVDLLAGDRGQLFLPLCSLHQICYLCGEAPPTTCDLVFLSEADTTCEGDMGCQRAARSALMALQELHDNLADELDGECEASPCLSATLKLNTGWQRAIQR